MLGVIHKGWGHKVFWLSYKGGGSWTKITKSFPVKIEFIYLICHGVDLNFHVRKGGPESKYSCAVHSDFYCFASADICRHGLLHVATRVAYTIYSLTDVQRWSLNAPLMLRHFSTSGDSSMCIGRRLPMLVVHNNFARWSLNALVNSDFIDVHRSTSADASRSQQLCALWMFVRIARVVPQKTSVDRRRPMQNDGSLNAP